MNVFSGFAFVGFYFSLQVFVILFMSLPFFLILLSALFHILLYFINNSSFLINKYMFLAS